jgi:hypothetical protein
LDADQSLFSTDGKQQIFIGHVVAIGPNVLVSADKIILDKRVNRIEASGHALLMSEGQIFTGELISYDLFNEDLYIEDANMVTKEKGKAKEVISEILGFSQEELDFEAYRKKKLKEINEKKQVILSEAQTLKSDQQLSDEIIEKLALLLEQEALTKKQLNPILSRKSKATRNVFLRRRKFWEEGKKAALSVGSGASSLRYLKLKSDSLSRIQGNDYRANDVMFTPCKCEDDESPPWAIKASQVKAQMGGYLDFYDSYIEIAGVPVLYLPFMKLPIKGERQSGFLAPNFYSSTETGTVLSSPIFLALSKNSDMTILPEFISKRGTRFGLEFRRVMNEGSKWTLNLETIKDRLWLEETSERNAVSDAVFTGLEEARTRPSDVTVDPSLSGIEAFREAVKNPGYWANQELYSDCLFTTDADELEKCKDVDIKSQLDAPENFWRGKVEWSGVEYIAPRFSFESFGNYLSDHRYVEELEFSRELSEVVKEEKVQTFGTAKYRFNLDAEKFNLSLGGSFGDYLLESTSWAGQQMPFTLDLSTPMYTVYHSDLVNVYIRASYEYKNIEVFDFDFPLLTEGETYSLGSGSWQRSYLDLLIPVFPNSVANSHLFSTLERRDVNPTGVSGLETNITSYRAGFEVSIPMEGEAKILKSAEKTARDSFYAGTYAEHVFSLGARFSFRPFVVKDGLYGENIQLDSLDDSGDFVVDQSKSTYFASDQSVEVNNSFSDDELTMFKHQKVTLFTNHSFGVFDKRWVKKGLLGIKDDGKKNSRELAKDLLLRAMDRNVSSTEEIDKDDQYTLQKTDRKVPLNLGAKISYDFLKANERDELQESFDEAVAYNKVAEALGEELLPVPELPEPWSELHFSAKLNYFGFNLNYITEYNIYTSVSSKNVWTLGFPRVFKTDFQMSFTKEETASIDDLGRLVSSVTTTQGGVLVSKVIPNFNIVSSYYKRNSSGLDEGIYRHTEALQYLPSSQCWGLSFVRNKPYELEEESATYRLELNIILDGQNRSFPNMAGAFIKHLPGGGIAQ